MRRTTAFSLFTSGLFLLFSCKKDPGAQQQQIPTSTKVTVTITTTGPGTTSPTGTITYVSGASVTVTATPNAGATMSITDSYDGTSIVTASSPYTFTATSAHAISVAYTTTPIPVDKDTILTTHQLDSLNTKIQLQNGLVWHYATAETKVDGTVFNWQPLFSGAGYPCTQDDYLQFTTGNNLLWSINGTSCSYGWKVADQTGTYKFINNGKGIAFTHDSKIDTLIVNKFTQTSGAPDSLVVTSRDAYQTRTSIRYHCFPAKP